MSSLRRLDKDIEVRNVEMLQQRLAIQKFCSTQSKKLSRSHLLKLAGVSFAGGFVVEKLCDKESKTGKAARAGAGFAFSSLFHSFSTLSSFSAIFVYAQLKQLLFGDK